MTSLSTLILAAGKGTRMVSQLPKVLHHIAHKSLLEHVYDLSAGLADNRISIVIGHGAAQVQQALAHCNVNWVEQREQLGTGHAVQQASGAINETDTVLILYGDVPLLKAETVQILLSHVSEQSLALLTVTLDDATGYGRIVRGADGKVGCIVEQKYATASQLAIKEVNTGIMAMQGGALKRWLGQLTNQNAQGEYYLTDVIALAVADGINIVTSQPKTVSEVLGVNNRVQLAELERVYQREQAHTLMLRGVTLKDPARFDLRGRITQLGEDVSIDINVLLEGDNCLGNNVNIGANCILNNVVLGDNVVILPNSVLENAVVGANSRIGPYARLRPETVLGDHVHIGNFVELKKSTVAAHSKINHLSYIGDTLIGSGVNIGAGTITCNYDGVNKWQTIIEDGAFIGSDTQLIAPVTVGKNATIGAGSTITKDTPAQQLTLSRSKQVSIASWQRPIKQEKN